VEPRSSQESLTPSTGAGAHGLLVSRNGKYLYIANRVRARSRCSTSPPASWCTSGGSPAAARPIWAASPPTAPWCGGAAATTAWSPGRPLSARAPV